MIVKCKIIFFAASNPFFDAYIHSDYLGKLIFIGLVILSICSWIILLHKIWLTYQARRFSLKFQALFQLQRANPLNIELEQSLKNKQPNPFYDIYSILKKHTKDLLNKNKRFGQENEGSISYLSPADISFVDNHLMSGIASQIQNLEKNLFVLATVVSLGPFLGLLGTVWGILTTFSELQAQGGGGTNQMVLGGLSLALATTVLGLLDAIPALIGYNYLKNTISAFQTEMEGFSTEILASVEMQYRKVDVL
jgi:biopolymer transport protein TolQ